MNFIQEANKTDRLAFVQINRSIDKRFRFVIICEIFELRINTKRTRYHKSSNGNFAE